MTAATWLIYTRVSTDDQAEAGVSLSMQLESCRSYARSRGWTVAGEESDDGWSGATLKRPGLQRALDAIRERKAAGVIVWKLDRLTRSLRNLLDVVDLCDQSGAALVSVTEAIDASTPAGRLMLNMLGSFGQHERETIAARVKAAMAHVKGRGYWTGGHIPPGCQVVAEGERRRLVRGDHAGPVEQVWAQVLAGDGLMTIARRLQDAGVPAPGHIGKQATRGWTPKAAWNLIRSVQVTGVLVDATTQAAAIQALSNRQTPTRRGPDRKPGGRAAVPSILAGLARCPRCGSALVQAVAHGNGGAYRYLRCSLANKNRSLCPQKDVRAELVEGAALRGIVDAVARGDYQQAILADYEAAQAQAAGARAEKARLSAERDQLSARIGAVARELQVGSAEFRGAMSALGDDARRVDQRLAQLAGVLAVADVDRMNVERVLDLMRQTADLLPEMVPAEASEVLRAWLQSVAVHEDHVELLMYAPQKCENPQPKAGGSHISQYWYSHGHGMRTGQVYRVRAGVGYRSPVAAC